MKRSIKLLVAVMAILLVLTATMLPAFAANEPEETTSAVTTVAEEETKDDSIKAKIYASAALIAVVAGVGAAAMAIAIGKGSEGISKQPEAASNIRTNTMLGLVFIETAIIYALIVAILIIFVL